MLHVKKSCVIQHSIKLSIGMEYSMAANNVHLIREIKTVSIVVVMMFVMNIRLKLSLVNVEIVQMVSYVMTHAKIVCQIMYQQLVVQERSRHITMTNIMSGCVAHALTIQDRSLTMFARQTDVRLITSQQFMENASIVTMGNLIIQEDFAPKPVMGYDKFIRMIDPIVLLAILIQKHMIIIQYVDQMIVITMK